MAIKKLLIANRGEIAVRIVRAAQGLGIPTVQVHSMADANSLAVRMADEAVDIGPPHAAKSYLNIDNLLEAARKTGADAIHPGYGFLSENAKFAQAVEDAGLIFVGPRPETISRLGDKAAAREAAKQAGVPTVPGSEGVLSGADEAKAAASEIGYPVMIKAAAGGGGRGIKIAENETELAKLVAEARNEAQAAFGDNALYMEKVIRDARHIEVQVLGDGTDAVHCFERECSLQRRRQKVWEEAPSAALTEDQRQAICESAVALAKSVGYRGAGTLEFLFDDRSGAHYFIEMNTRIQVEHPVTEMVTGIDLVQEMIRICGGEPLRLKQADITLSGHAIECRINAEDPSNNFMPGPGVIGKLGVPEADHVRFDTLLYEGYQVPPFYDSLLGKLIVHGPDRAGAIERMAAALEGLTIEGLKTTIPLHKVLAASDAVRANAVHTQFLEPWLAEHPIAPE
ncbi:MAG: acetyl-CoA carboxylase biotin carboxylase subunit [Minwuia sp.]|uniref:acetyl-CoA carboxylase biotin carboxylase subunit n=1 Tax=Minwuia sp. TaxID=2493630 RepID=UPI003A85C1C6